MKQFWVFLVVVLLTVTVGHGAALSFFNTSSFDYVTGDGSSGAAQAGWVVGAFVDNGNGSYDPGVDSLYASTTLLDAGSGNMIYGYGGADNSLAGTESMLCVVFDQATVPGAGDTFYYAECGNSTPYPWTMSGDPKDNVDFGGDGSWVLVPEPSTFALFALGMVALVAGSKKIRK